jgi:amidohydrolase
MTTASAQERERAHARVREAIADLRPLLVDVSMDLHAHPELAMEEHHAADRLTAELAREGFAVERPVAGMATAFVGRRGTAGRHPRVAILMEYDALPGVGHACGHNLIAAGGLGAALAVARALPEVPGELMAVGTPGEEGEGGKIIELEAGVFDGVDSAIMFHPGSHNWAIRHATASSHVVMKFYGKAAHAAGAPEKGINALNAVIHTFVHIDALRQHIPETSRIHGIITHGGDAPNVVPEYAEAKFLVRSLTMRGVEELMAKVRACAEGAALANGARVEFETGRTYAERKNNRVLAERFARYLEATGETVEEPVLRGGTGSSDIGNVSLVLPTIHPYMAIAPKDTPGHSREMAAAAASGRGQEAMLHVAEAMAHVAVDLFLEEGLVERAWEAFHTSGPDLPA